MDHCLRIEVEIEIVGGAVTCRVFLFDFIFFPCCQRFVEAIFWDFLWQGFCRFCGQEPLLL
jgi:hypothetical protein